ncbi:hypothetical protein KM043_004417 [Ampulex compressa]|nr:hypothetical protein KM043_004417 [Ampulex compressa]
MMALTVLPTSARIEFAEPHALSITAVDSTYVRGKRPRHETDFASERPDWMLQGDKSKRMILAEHKTIEDPSREKGVTSKVQAKPLARNNLNNEALPRDTRVEVKPLTSKLREEKRRISVFIDG